MQGGEEVGELSAERERAAGSPDFPAEAISVGEGSWYRGSQAHWRKGSLRDGCMRSLNYKLWDSGFLNFCLNLFKVQIWLVCDGVLESAFEPNVL